MLTSILLFVIIFKGGESMNKSIEKLKAELLTCQSVTDEMKNQVQELINDEEMNEYPEVEELHKIYLFKCWHNVFTDDQLEIIYEKAYRDYHSEGLSDIDCGFFELAEFVNAVKEEKNVHRVQ